MGNIGNSHPGLDRVHIASDCKRVLPLEVSQILHGLNGKKSRYPHRQQQQNPHDDNFFPHAHPCTPSIEFALDVKLLPTLE
jgi:hypothetical protein